MFKKYCVNEKNSFKLKDFVTDEKDRKISKEEGQALMAETIADLDILQQKMYAEKKEGLIIVFQAMDAAGKDGTIRHVLSCLSPQGVRECSFKKPSETELQHDYLWRVHQMVPKRGDIAIFNRSHYEDVLIGKVRKLYKNIPLAERIDKSEIIEKRYQEINNFEEYLYDNGIRVLKFFLNVSNEEQVKRFLSRIEEPEKNWKFSEGDVREREVWKEYQEAFEDAINKTASKHCPWYVIPADDKWFMRLLVSLVIEDTLKDMDPHYPTVSEDRKKEFSKFRDLLENELK